MQVLLDVMTEISTQTIINVKNSVERPIYKLTFKNENGQLIEYVDPNTNIMAKMIGPSYETELDMTTGDNFRTWKYKEEENISDLVGGQYYLLIY